MLTKNAERTLKETLQMLEPFSEVILCDTGSTDRTLEIARSFGNVRVLQASLHGFGPLRNWVAQQASHDWILALDSDERLSEELSQELQAFQGTSDHVYAIEFHNYYRGKWIKGCGWYPEQHVRLYHRGKTRFSHHRIHERVLTDGMHVAHLRYAIHHTPYLSVADFLQKMQHYSELFAEEYRGKRSSSFQKALIHGIGTFIKSYLWKRGFLLGQEGFMISLYQANTAFYKYMKLAEVASD
jgi:glycosyltransferase involved in cell wall biosynthesis